MNRIKEIIKQSGYTQQEIAAALKWHPSALSKMLNGEQQITMEHLEQLGEFFQVDPGVFFRPKPHRIETSIPPQIQKDAPSHRHLYQFWLVADKDQRPWLRESLDGYDALKEEGVLIEKPTGLHVRLPVGRTLLGRSVGSLWMAFERSIKPTEYPFPSELCLSIARYPDPFEHDLQRNDRNFSRYHCDITVTAERPEASLYICGRTWVDVGVHRIERGQAIFLHAPVKLVFPNGQSLQLERTTLNADPKDADA